jgi:hypothetical protein
MGFCEPKKVCAVSDARYSADVAAMVMTQKRTRAAQIGHEFDNRDFFAETAENSPPSAAEVGPYHREPGIARRPDLKLSCLDKD